MENLMQTILIISIASIVFLGVAWLYLNLISISKSNLEKDVKELQEQNKRNRIEKNTDTEPLNKNAEKEIKSLTVTMLEHQISTMDEDYIESFLLEEARIARKEADDLKNKSPSLTDGISKWAANVSELLVSIKFIDDYLKENGNEETRISFELFLSASDKMHSNKEQETKRKAKKQSSFDPFMWDSESETGYVAASEEKRKKREHNRMINMLKAIPCELRTDRENDLIKNYLHFEALGRRISKEKHLNAINRTSGIKHPTFS